METGAYDLALLDIKLPDMDGMEILKSIRKKRSDLSVIIMTGYSTVSNVAEAMKLGASDYLSKPLTDDELTAAVARAFKTASESNL